jgi:alpha-tubulin suppressor-like RCC1 family protein
LGRVGERMSDRSRLQTFLVPTVVPIRKRGRIVIDIACGTYSSFFLLSDGSVYACGLNNYGQLGVHELGVVYSPTPVDGAQGVTKVFPGQHHTLFLKASQTGSSLLSCGRPTYGRLGQKGADVGSDSGSAELRPVDGLEGIDVSGAAAGLAVSGCFDAQGVAYTWGFGTSNQLCKGDDDDDEVIPRKVAATKRFQAHVVQLDVGGQHGAMVAYNRE